MYQGERSFSVNLSEPSNEALIDEGEANIQIRDQADLPELVISDLTVNETDGTAQIIVNLVGQTQLTTVFNYRVIAGTADTDDFEVGNDNRTEIEAGQSQVTLSIPIVDDAIYEGIENFQVELYDPQNARVRQALATITIIDDETPSELYCASGVNGNESDASIRFTITRSGDTSQKFHLITELLIRQPSGDKIFNT